MTNTVNIIPSHSNRYRNITFSSPISAARYTNFMKQTDILISKLNQLLIDQNQETFEVIYGIMAHNINQDFFNLRKLKRKEIKVLLESALVFSLDELSVLDENPLEKVIEKIFSEYSKLIELAKKLLDVENNLSLVSKIRGIMMEVLAVSIFGEPEDFMENHFVWDFNIIYNEEKVNVANRETADIYYRDNARHYIGEVKCRPRGIEESQLDFINHISNLFGDEETDKIILHGSTSENYDIEKMGYKDKLDEFSVYPTDMISNLIRKLQY